MELNSAISEIYKALACFALVLAVALFPPTTAHADFSPHGDQEAVLTSADSLELMDMHFGNLEKHSGHSKFSSVADNSDESHESSQCCSGFCLSAILTENHSVLSAQATSGHYLARRSQIASFDPNGFLRPPRHLI